MTESNRRRRFSRLAKNYSADKVKRNRQYYSESDEEEILNVLSIRYQKKVIHEYNSKDSQTTVCSLARKYNVSSRYISGLLRNQKSILKSSKCTIAETLTSLEQIDFLDMVMYEYLERTLYHNIPVDDVNFQKKAEEVKDCMAILKSKPSYAWLKNFKKKYGIQDFSKETLRKEIQLKEEKRSTLDPVDMVIYVEQRMDVFLKAHIEIAPVQLSEYTGANSIPLKITTAVPADPTTNDNQQDDSDDDKLTSQNSDVHHIFLESESEIENEDDEYLTIYEIIDDEASSSPAADNHSPPRISQVTDIHNFNESNSSPPPSLQNVENDSRETDISPNTGYSITIKTEPPSNDDELMDTNNKQISSYILPEKDVIIKTEVSPSSKLDKTDINTTIVFERSVNYVMENNNGINDPQHSTRLPIYHTQSYSNTNLPPPDVLDSDIKPTIIFEKCDEFIMENNDGANDHPHPPSLVTTKRPCPHSTLPDIDTLEEAMKHLKVLENYVMLKENFRAIGIITQLEDAIKKTPKQ